MFYFTLWLLKFINLIWNNFNLKKIFKKDGSFMIGKIALKMQKNFIKNFKQIDFDKVIFVTGTNGKSTTTNLLMHTLRKAGYSVATNAEGANMITGIATILIKNSTLSGKFNKDFMVLEIDERSLEKIYRELPGKNLCITNLQKDQVQRNGDPDFIYRKFENVINSNMSLFLNNEEPRSKSLEKNAGKTYLFSMQKNKESFVRNGFYDVTLACPRCNHKIVFDYYNLGNIGKFHCSNCEYKSEENAYTKLADIDFKTGTFKEDGNVYKLKYKTPFMFYNYGLVITVCKKFKIPYEKIQNAFDTFVNPADRTDQYTFKGKTIKYLRMKQENPDTLQNAINIVANDKAKKVIYIGLYEIKDFPPAYSNTFYFFDCDIDKMIESNVEKFICFSKTVSYDTANRLVYAGVPREKIKIYDVEDDFNKIFEDLDKFESKNIYLISGMKPYHKIQNFFGKED